MSLYRLSLVPMLLSLILGACASPTIQTPAGIVPQPTRKEITRESPPTEVIRTATATQALSPSVTLSAPPAAGQPTTTPTMPPIGESSPPPIPTQALSSPVPTMPGTEIPWSDWEGPGLMYVKEFYDVVISSIDGAQKSVLAYMPDIGPWKPGYSPATGRIVVGSKNALWVVEPGREPRTILELDADQYVESPVITGDGSRIAYSLVRGFGEEGIQQLWTIKPDGTENTLVVDNTGQFITDPGPFRLRPKAWSIDNAKVYLITTSDSEATPKGLYAADLASGTIEKALTPQVTLWDMSFSPDRSRIAYRTFQWKPVPGNRPEPGPPFTLNVTDLTTGETSTLLESETDQYFHPIWSPDGNRLAYSVRQGPVEAEAGLFTIEIANGEVSRIVPGSANRRLIPWSWFPGDRLAYTDGDLAFENMFVYADGDLFSGNMWNSESNLYTIDISGTEKSLIDAGGIIVLGGMEP